MTEQNTTPSNDPWVPATSAAIPLPNLFRDLDGNAVTVTTQQTDVGGYVQITFGTAELRLDPIEAERLGSYVTKAADELHGQCLDVAFAEARKRD